MTWSKANCIDRFFISFLLQFLFAAQLVLAQPAPKQVFPDHSTGMRKVVVPFQYSSSPSTLSSRVGSVSPSALASSTLSGGLQSSQFGGLGSIAYARQQGVKNAWKYERELVLKTGRGTYRWTSAQQEELILTGSIRGFEGHHINNVSAHPELAEDPRNIKFVKGRQGHLDEHGGSFRNSTEGRMIDRQKMLENYEWGVRSKNLILGVGQVAGGAFLLYEELPEAIDSYKMLRLARFRDQDLKLQLAQHSLGVGSGAVLATGGAARIVAFGLARLGVEQMHSVLGILRLTSSAAGPISMVLVVAEAGVYTYRWHHGYISYPEFITHASVVAGLVGGGIAGAKVGNYLGGGVGAAVGSVAGGIGGAWGAQKAADTYFEEAGRVEEDSCNEHLFASYGVTFNWSNENLRNALQEGQL